MAAKRTSTPAQKAAQARLSAASKQASREGKKGQPFKNRVKALLKGTGGGAKPRPKTAGGPRPRAVAATARATAGVKRAGHGFLASLNAKRVGAGLLVLDGAIESFNNAQKKWPSPGTRFQQILAPLADGVLAAKTFHKAASSSTLSPGLMADLWNWKPFGKTPDITGRRVVNAIPSATGWWLGIQRYREIRKVESKSVHQNVLPRLSAMTGLKIRNARAIGGPWVAAVITGRSAPRDLFNSVLDAPVTAVGLGAAGSKLIAKAHVF